MAEALNPYRLWLELDTDAPSLNHYELLDLPLFEEDVEKIHHAADRALARVRSHRPGAHAAQWAQLLDELAQAKTCLSNSADKTQYDAALRAEQPGGSGHDETQGGTSGVQPEIATVNQMPDLFPPGMVPSSPAAPATKSKGSASAPRSATTRSATTRSATTRSATTRSATTPPPPPTPARQKPPPPPTPTPPAAETERLLDDPFDEGVANVTGISDPVPVPDKPVNAHVAPPREQQASMLPMAVSVVAVVVVVSLIVVVLAMRGSFGGSSAKPPTPVTTPPSPSLNQKPPSTNSAAGNQQTAPAVTANHNPQPPAVDPALRGGMAAAKSSPNINSATPAVDPPPGTGSGPQDPVPPDGSATGTPDNGATTTTPPPVPTRDQLVQLGRTLGEARLALSQHNFDLAQLEIQKANTLAVLPEHQAIVARLKELAGHSRSFWNTVATVVGGFQGAEELSVGSGGLVVLVVETGPNSITVRKEGQNLQYSFVNMPPGLALAIAKTRLDGGTLEDLLQLGACLATVADRKPAYLDEARNYWLEAQDAGADVEQLLLTLTDSYDLAQ